ncbi:barstar family protein [Pseudonocardia sp. ICBG1293]|uniref:barstar family protein n=1 Tax=Pseudonocardia sp. ICBG1293 TaxID=2844382 RepID=UPI001CC96428|nr:barstar family protein [Pseudonocardia sp. ICBG1293]
MSTLPRESAGTGPAVDAARGRVGDPGVVAVVAGVADRAAVLSAFGRALGFPGYYGHNLDALADCLGDLSWLPAGPVEIVLADGPLAAADPGTHAAVLDVLAEAVATTAGTERPLRVTLAGPAT